MTSNHERDERSRCTAIHGANCAQEVQPDARGILESTVATWRDCCLHVLEQIGSGSFGDIYLGVHKVTGQRVALKLESSRAKHPQLAKEVAVYRKLEGAVGVPRIYWYGLEGQFNVMVMDLLGRSLEDLFTRCGRRFTLKTVLMIADQAIERLQMVRLSRLCTRCDCYSPLRSATSEDCCTET